MIKINFNLCLLFMLAIILNIGAQGTLPPDNPRPKKGDIPFSLRFHHLDLNDDNNNRPNWSNVIGQSNQSGFGADNILWHYRARRINGTTYDIIENVQNEFISQAGNLGYAVQYTIPTYVNHFKWDYNQNLGAYEERSDLLNSCVCKRLDGTITRASWEGTYAKHLDITKDGVAGHFINELIDMINDGDGTGVNVISFHQDSPGKNYSLLKFGGCFSNDGDDDFRDWLDINYTGSLSAIGITTATTEGFNISDHIYSFIDNNNDINFYDNLITKISVDDLPIIDLYKQYVKERVQEFYAEVRTGVNNHLNGSGITVNFSANNLNQFYWLEDSFDFWISEIYKDDFANYSLANEVRQVALFNKSTNFDENDPQDWNSALTLASLIIDDNRKMIPLSYSTGLSFVVPWDAYTGGNSDRMFGSPSDYDDLYDFVREQDDSDPDVSGDTGLFKGHTTIEESSHLFMESAYVTSGNMGLCNNETVNTYILKVSNLGVKTWRKGTEVKIGNTVYSTVCGTGVGEIKLDSSVASQINIGDPVWFINTPISDDLGAEKVMIYKDKMYDWSINSPEIDVTSVHIDNIISPSIGFPAPLPARVQVVWPYTGQASFSIPLGSKVLIGEMEYTTNVKTFAGYLYFEPSVESQIAIGDPIWSITSPTGEILYPFEKRPFVINSQQKGSKQYSEVTGLNVGASSNGYERMEIHWSNDQHNYSKIPKGSTVMINGYEFQTVGHTGVGNIYIAKGSDVKIGDNIWSIRSPSGEIIYPATNHLVVSGVNQGANNYPGRTTLNWTNQNNSLTIPIGSKVKVNDKIYLTTIHTNVGNIYLPESAVNEINVGDPIYFIYDNNQLTLPESVNYDKVKMHLINLDNNAVTGKVTVKVRKHRFDGFSEVISPLNNASMVSFENGDYIYYEVLGLEDWAVFMGYNEIPASIVQSQNSKALESKTKVYPNPTREILNIRSESTLKSFAIYDINGRQLMMKRIEAKQTMKYVIDVKSLSTGIYFLNLETEEGKKAIKFIKN